MYKNVFSQIAEANKQRSDANRAAEEQRDVEILLSLRNDNTNADEAVIFIKIIMWGLTAFMVYLGFEYYSKTFTEMFSPQAAFVFAIALPAVVEIAKIKLLGKFFRACFFGWIGTKQHWSAVAYWLIVGVIGVGSFWWSYTISTGGIKEVAKQNAEVKNRQTELAEQIAAATSNIDAQIAAIDKSNEDAGSLKNKKGRTNWESQPILSSNAQSRLSLLSQKEAITKQVTENYRQTEGDVKLKVSAWAQFIERFGGWGELGVFICLCAIGFFQRRLFEANKDAVRAAEEKDNASNHSASPPSHNQHSHTQNGHAVHNNAQQRYYFTRTSPTGDVEAALEPQPLFQEPDDREQTPVSQPPQTVTQIFGEEDAYHADDVLLLAMKRLKGFDDNFDQKHRKNETVSQNIHTILDAVLFKMKGTFRPSPDVHAKFSAYVLDTLFPLLLEKGYRYPQQTQFEGWLRTVAPIVVT